MFTDFRIEKYFRKLRGSFKDPFSCLGIAAAILFLISSFSFIFNFPTEKGDPPFLTENFSQDFFIGPAKKFLPESPDFLLVEKTSLRAATPPVMITPQVLGIWLGEPEAKKGITKYIVEEGDSLWAIASKFGISLETILWANELDSLLIKPGQELLILPVSGVMHLVKSGDTVSEIAAKYKTDPEKIITFNDLSGEGDIVINEVLIIPDGKLPSVSIVQPVTSYIGYSSNNFYGQSHAYPYGQCTWWVAQKRAIPSWGHAKNWLDKAIISGYPVCKSSWCIPQVGAVISLKGNRYYGHVGYVEEVRGDKIVFSEMNYIGWGRMNYRTLRIGSTSIKGYIY